MKKQMIILSMLLLLSSCNRNVDTTLTFIDFASDKQYRYMKDMYDQYDSLTITVEDKVKMQLNDESQQRIDSAYKIQTNSLNELYFTNELLDINNSIYVKDDLMYIESGLTKLKAPLDQEILDSLQIVYSLPEYNIKEMQNITSTVKENAVIIEFDYSTMYLNKLVGFALISNQEQIVLEDIQYDITSAHTKINVDSNGNIQSWHSLVDLIATYKDNSIYFYHEKTVNYENINNTSIDFPSNLENYVLIEA